MHGRVRLTIYYSSVTLVVGMKAVIRYEICLMRLAFAYGKVS